MELRFTEMLPWGQTLYDIKGCIPLVTLCAVVLQCSLLGELKAEYSDKTQCAKVLSKVVESFSPHIVNLEQECARLRKLFQSGLLK